MWSYIFHILLGKIKLNEICPHDEKKKSFKTERIYVQKGKARTGNLDSCAEPTQGKFKKFEIIHQKKKLIDMKNLLVIKEEIEL